MPRSVPVATLVVLVAACSNEAPSGLQQRDGSVPEVAAPEVQPPLGAPGPAAQAAIEGPPPASEMAEIRLSLGEGSTYQVITLGNVTFGTMMQPVGFAREERITLSQCEGEGCARACALEHRYVNFEAEPPGGRFLEADEQAVAKLVTGHKLLATGARPDKTTILEGPKEQAEAKAGLALSEAHRFFCLRFPDEPIGVGAKWRSSCHMRAGGVIDTRNMQWELQKLERDPDTGLRAEIAYVGEYISPGAKSPLQGVIKGMLFFLVDAGEPHLIREEFTTATDSASAYSTHTSTVFQFTKLVKGPDGKETIVRVDGKPLPQTEAKAGG